VYAGAVRVHSRGQKWGIGAIGATSCPVNGTRLLCELGS